MNEYKTLDLTDNIHLENVFNLAKKLDMSNKIIKIYSNNYILLGLFKGEIYKVIIIDNGTIYNLETSKYQKSICLNDDTKTPPLFNTNNLDDNLLYIYNFKTKYFTNIKNIELQCGSNNIFEDNKFDKVEVYGKYLNYLLENEDLKDINCDTLIIKGKYDICEYIPLFIDNISKNKVIIIENLTSIDLTFMETIQIKEMMKKIRVRLEFKDIDTWWYYYYLFKNEDTVLNEEEVAIESPTYKNVKY